MLIQAH